MAPPINTKAKTNAILFINKNHQKGKPNSALQKYTTGATAAIVLKITSTSIFSGKFPHPTQMTQVHKAATPAPGKTRRPSGEVVVSSGQVAVRRGGRLNRRGECPAGWLSRPAGWSCLPAKWLCGGVGVSTGEVGMRGVRGVRGVRVVVSTGGVSGGGGWLSRPAKWSCLPAKWLCGGGGRLDRRGRYAGGAGGAGGAGVVVSTGGVSGGGVVSTG